VEPSWRNARSARERERDIVIPRIEVIPADQILRIRGEVCVNEMQRANARCNQQDCFEELEQRDKAEQ